VGEQFPGRTTLYMTGSRNEGIASVYKVLFMELIDWGTTV